MSTASSILVAKTLPAKAWDRVDMTLHCSSFSKCGGGVSHRLGGGRKTRAPHSAAAADEHAFNQFPMQLALVDYGDKTLRRPSAPPATNPRRANSRRGSRFCAICPPVSKSTTTTAAIFMAGATCAAGCGAAERKGLNAPHQHCPGKMFSTSDAWTPFFRFNTSGRGASGKSRRSFS